MRRYMLPLVAASAIGLATSLASAADLPRKAPPMAPPPPPPLTWTGCYIGANIGGAWGRFELDTPFGEASRNGKGGFAGGGQIGCDYQFAGSGFVIGFRNMFDGTTNHKDRDFTLFNAAGAPVATGSASFHNRWFDALTGRIGFSGPNALWLAYFQGGGVWSRVTADLNLYSVPSQNLIGSGDWGKTKTGWTIGGGFEYRFAPQWSVFVEGNYYDFGTRERTIFTPVNTVCVNGCAFSGKTTAVTGLVGVNYRFWTQ